MIEDTPQTHDLQARILLLFSCSVLSNYFVISWTVAHQALLSMRFLRHYRNRFGKKMKHWILDMEYQSSDALQVLGRLGSVGNNPPALQEMQEIQV